MKRFNVIQQVLTPQACAIQLASKLNFWYSADNITVVNGLVAGATDLTGNNRDGVQGTTGNRLTYFETDPLFGDRPSFGSLTMSGVRGLNAPGSLSYRHQIFSCYYVNGTQSTWAGGGLTCISSGSGTGGSLRIRSNSAGSQTLNNANSFTSTLSQGGRSQSNIFPPMPASVYTATAAFNSTLSLRLGSNQIVADQVFVGAFRHFVGASQALTTEEIRLIEGVITWNDGTQNTLISTHPYRNQPPFG